MLGTVRRANGEFWWSRQYREASAGRKRERAARPRAAGARPKTGVGANGARFPGHCQGDCRIGRRQQYTVKVIGLREGSTIIELLSITTICDSISGVFSHREGLVSPWAAAYLSYHPRGLDKHEDITSRSSYRPCSHHSRGAASNTLVVVVLRTAESEDVSAALALPRQGGMIVPGIAIS
jgi:hypothetical protein